MTQTKVSRRDSLIFRAIVLTLVLVLLGIGSVVLYVSQSLQSHLRRQLGEQQLSVVTAVAKEVNDQVTQRLQALDAIASEMDAGLLGRPAALQTRLEQRPLLPLLFNGGVFVAGPDGTAIADLLPSPNRIGVNYMDRDYMVTALKDGKPAIGRPVIGKQLKSPVFTMAMPVRDADGKVVGAVVGVTDLGKPNFLDHITQNPYGVTGGYELIAAQSRLVVTATDRRRVMEQLPAEVVDTWLARFAKGVEGSIVSPDQKGVNALVSAKGIPAAGWYVLARLPAAEAFAPVDDVKRDFLVGTVLLALLTGALVWWALSRLLAPLAATADAMAALSGSPEIPQPLSTAQQGEIGRLVDSFNRILQTWKQRETALQHSEQNLAITLNSIGDAVIATDTSGRITAMNPAAEALTGWALTEARGRELVEVFHIINAQTRQLAFNPVQSVMERGQVVGLANHTKLLARDGREYHIADSAAPIRDASRTIVGVVLVFSNVTEKYRVELALRESEQHYRSLLENLSSGVVVHRADTSILLSNPKAASLLGLTQDQMLGKAAPDPDWCFLRDDGSPMALDGYPVNRVLATGEPLQNYVAGVRHPGRSEATWVICNAYPVHDEEGRILQVVVTFTDITQRKQTELALQHSRVMMERTENLARVASFEWEVVSNKVTWSPGMYRIFGRDPALGTPNLEGQAALYTPESTQALFAAVGKAVSDGTPYTLELMAVPADGQQHPCVAMGFPERDASGRVIRVVGLLQDIAERKRAEARLQLAASVFHHAREGITITDADGIIVDINEAFTRVTGYSREEAIGQNPRMLQSGRQDKAFYEAMWNALTVQGHWSGEIWNRRKNGEVYPELLTISRVCDEHGMTHRYMALFSDITTIKEHQQQLEHIAHFDPLTNLPNRRMLGDRLQQAMAQALRRDQKVAVAYLDIDGFKNINDRYGHDVGDQLLIHLSVAMRDSLREGDTLARIGGDEFVAVLIDLDRIESCAPMLDRLLQAAGAPVALHAGVLQCSISIGVSFYPQASDIEADQLLRQADQAMYQAKLGGKNRYHVFDAAQDSSMRVHFEGIQRMRLALARDEFVLYYQPKVNMRSGQVIGVEALIRWQHPEKGLQAPAEFLPAIEDHALAVEIGEWVIDSALTQIEVWRGTGLDLAVSVNIGAHQLQQDDFVARLQFILAKHQQVRPASLELEVLETSALADIAQVSKVIEDCHQLGVKFALDDFGTGYSSLTYLKRLRVAMLKIDQSFVCNMLDDPDDLAILQGVIGLAAAFGREVIAEGVETVAHGTLLLELGCELAQGYGIARPMSADQLPAWAASWTPDAQWSAESAIPFSNPA